jgi:hypothetical protein
VVAVLAEHLAETTEDQVDQIPYSAPLHLLAVAVAGMKAA